MNEYLNNRDKKLRSAYFLNKSLRKMNQTTEYLLLASRQTYVSPFYLRIVLVVENETDCSLFTFSVLYDLLDSCIIWRTCKLLSN